MHDIKAVYTNTDFMCVCVWGGGGTRGGGGGSTEGVGGKKIKGSWISKGFYDWTELKNLRQVIIIGMMNKFQLPC